MIYHNFYIYISFINVMFYWIQMHTSDTQRPNIVKLTKDIIALYNYWLYGYQLGLINIWTSI
jgi:hypothetical protein